MKGHDNFFTHTHIHTHTHTHIYIYIYIYVYIYIVHFSTSPNFCMSESQRQRKGDEGCGHRLAEDYYIDLFLTHIVIPYSGPYVFVSLTRGSQPGSTVDHCPLYSAQGFCPVFVVAPAGWQWLETMLLTVDTCVYIISNCPCVPIVNPRGLLPDGNLRELFTPTHHLFSGNYFVCTAWTTCPRDPWLTALSTVYMQHTMITNVNQSFCNSFGSVSYNSTVPDTFVMIVKVIGRCWSLLILSVRVIITGWFASMNRGTASESTVLDIFDLVHSSRFLQPERYFLNHPQLKFFCHVIYVLQIIW